MKLRYTFSSLFIFNLFLILHKVCLAGSILDSWETTKLIEIKQGSELSSKMDLYRTGGYDLSSGAPQNFKNWYTPTFTDLRFTYMTPINQSIGIIWGLSTGEKAPKYSVDPSIKVGLVMRHEFDKNSFLSLKGTTILGGRLRESSCTADYGEIGGVQQVNCRLAASALQPSQTLQYLHNDKPYNYNTLLLQYTKNFD